MLLSMTFNKDLARRRQLRCLRKRVARVAAVKEASPCADCGVSYPAVVMDFDHVRGTKEANVSQLVRRASWARIEAEIAKCEVVCANCHRLRSADARPEGEVV